MPPDGRQPLALALSGGGFRATLAALGAIRCLADLGLLRDVRTVSSVSGGSITNGQLALAWPTLRTEGFTAAAVHAHVIAPIVRRVSTEAMKGRIIRNGWRLALGKSRSDLLAHVLDRWWFDGAQLEDLDPECRWIFNAANLTTGVRFGFERDVLGDYVTGHVRTAATGMRLSRAVAASAAVPGALSKVRLRGLDFPCGDRGDPELLDGAAYDNTGLEALDGPAHRDTFLVGVNAGGAFVTGRAGGLPIVGDLVRSNSMLYRQSTSLRTRWMVDRFQAFEAARDHPPRQGRAGVLFGLASTIGAGTPSPTNRVAEWTARFPEHRDFRGEDLAFIPTVFDRLELELCRRLIYRGWWLTGATIARYHATKIEVALDAIEAPSIEA